MAPFTKSVMARYDGKSFTPIEPLDLEADQIVNLTISTDSRSLALVDERPLQERLDALKNLKGRIHCGKLTDAAFKRDENMYPDRC